MDSGTGRILIVVKEKKCFSSFCKLWIVLKKFWNKNSNQSEKNIIIETKNYQINNSFFSDTVKKIDGRKKKRGLSLMS